MTFQAHSSGWSRNREQQRTKGQEKVRGWFLLLGGSPEMNPNGCFTGSGSSLTLPFPPHRTEPVGWLWELERSSYEVTKEEKAEGSHHVEDLKYQAPFTICLLIFTLDQSSKKTVTKPFCYREKRIIERWVSTKFREPDPSAEFNPQPREVQPPHTCAQPLLTCHTHTPLFWADILGLVPRTSAAEN